MELLDLYDNYGNKLNITIPRGAKYDTGNIMVSIIFIKNSDGKFLVQKTSKEKGSLYSFTGGHVNHNEDGLSTIIRELNEELGLVINKEEITFLELIKHPDKSCLINLYLLEKDIDLDTLKLQKEEVSNVYFMSMNEIFNLIDNNKFHLTHSYLFKKYFS